MNVTKKRKHYLSAYAGVHVTFNFVHYRYITLGPTSITCRMFWVRCNTVHDPLIWGLSAEVKTTAPCSRGLDPYVNKLSGANFLVTEGSHTVTIHKGMYIECIQNTATVAEEVQIYMYLYMFLY